MGKRTKLRNARPKAFLGESIAAAGITAASQMAAAVMQSNATKAAAKQQADATKTGAENYAEAITAQTENSNRLQEQNIAFQKQENEQMRDIMKQSRMNLQMLQGKANTDNQLEANRIVAKCGGKAKRSRRSMGGNSFLRGMNIPVTASDGGYVMPLGQTPEGFPIGMAIGNDHDHYHKTKGGTYKSGVGINVPGYGIVEAEGNQNSKLGELIMATPNDIMFISKHNIKGFNPAKAVLAGMNPIDAFRTQEAIKYMYGIKDNGTKAELGGIYRNKLKCGGRTKKVGGGIWNYYDNDKIWAPHTQYENYPGVTTPYSNNNNQFDETKNNNWKWFGKLRSGWGLDEVGGKAQLAGAFTNLIGGGIANGILAVGNNRAKDYQLGANNLATSILTDAYNRMHGINSNALNRKDYQAAHAMAAIEAPDVNVTPETTLVDRSLQRQLSGIRKNSISSAASLNRMNTAEVGAFDQRSKIFNAANELEQRIRQGNAERITNVSNENANRDTQSLRDWANANLQLLQYNNDIENEKISGIAQARANGLMQNAEILANNRRTNAQNLSNYITNGIGGIANTLAGIGKQRYDLNNTLMFAPTSSKLNWYIKHKNDKGVRSILDSLPANSNYWEIQMLRNAANNYFSR